MQFFRCPIHYYWMLLLATSICCCISLSSSSEINNEVVEEQPATWEDFKYPESMGKLSSYLDNPYIHDAKEELVPDLSSTEDEQASSTEEDPGSDTDETDGRSFIHRLTGQQQIDRNPTAHKRANVHHSPMTALLPTLMKDNNEPRTLPLIGSHAALSKLNKNSDLLLRKYLKEAARRQSMKRSPSCMRKCMAQGLLHPAQCHSLC